MYKFLAGVGNALFFRGNELIGVGKCLSDDTFNQTITAEEVRAGRAHALYGRYFHDPNLTMSFTNTMFDMNLLAAQLGVEVNEGGFSLKEEQLTSTAGGVLTLTKTAIAFEGSVLAWYKKPADAEWTVATVSANTITVPGVTAATVFCVKYFWQNEDAQSVVLPVAYDPAILHVVVLHNLYIGGKDGAANQTDVNRIGRLITDIPRFQLNGNVSLTGGTTAATNVIDGVALPVIDEANCEGDDYYGTITEEIDGATWESRVTAVAVENSEIELIHTGTETLIVRTISNNRAVRRPNSDFNFAVVGGGTPIIAVTNAGVVTTVGSTTGTAYVTVDLKGRTDLDAAIVKVTVS